MRYLIFLLLFCSAELSAQCGQGIPIGVNSIESVVNTEENHLGPIQSGQSFILGNTDGESIHGAVATVNFCVDTTNSSGTVFFPALIEVNDIDGNFVTSQLVSCGSPSTQLTMVLDSTQFPLSFTVWNSICGLGSDPGYLVFNCTNCPLGQVLPIEILEMKGYADDDYNVVTVDVGESVNNEMVILESSNNGIQWSDVDEYYDVYSYQHLSFIDRYPYPTTYYRLYQLDRDGTFQYSDVISVTRDNNQKVYTHNNTVNVESDRESEAILFDVLGRKTFINVNQGTTTFNKGNGIHFLYLDGKVHKLN